MLRAGDVCGVGMERREGETRKLYRSMVVLCSEFTSPLRNLKAYFALRSRSHYFVSQEFSSRSATLHNIYASHAPQMTVTCYANESFNIIYSFSGAKGKFSQLV